MLKRTTKDVRESFLNEGCELLGDYVGVMKKMRYKCLKCNNVSEINWNNFSRGKRCPYCGKGKRKKKYTIEEVRKIFEDRGCKLLDDKYKNHSELMLYKCRCGEIAKISLSAFLHQNQNCKKCGIKKNSGKNSWIYKSYKEICDYFENQGCKLITPSWEGTEQVVSNLKLEYQCECGRMAVCIWNNFRKGKRCGYCRTRGKVLTLQEAKDIFLKNGCELLENEYKNCSTKMKFKCSCGNVDFVTLNKFTSSKQRCHKCAKLRMLGANHHAWRDDRFQLKMDKRFRSTCYRYLYRSLKATNQKKLGRTSEVLGYTPQQLQDHIKSHPNWEKVKDKSWHLDHIFPIMAFLEHGIKDIKIINALDNLQPLIGEENISKADTYNKEEFISWLNKKGITLNENYRKLGISTN